MISNARGEYWWILLPGVYKITATHENSYGRVCCEEEVTVPQYLSEGAKIQHLVLKPKYSASFSLTRYIESKTVKLKELEECITRKIFGDTCQIEQIRLLELINHERSDACVHLVTLGVDVTINNEALKNFFIERWGEVSERRANCDQESSKLRRRLKIFLTEFYVDDRPTHDGWNITLQSMI